MDYSYPTVLITAIHTGKSANTYWHDYGRSLATMVAQNLLQGVVSPSR